MKGRSESSSASAPLIKNYNRRNRFPSRRRSKSEPTDQEAAVEEESQIQVMLLHVARKTSPMSIFEVNF